jgi:hypothetical protein
MGTVNERRRGDVGASSVVAVSVLEGEGFTRFTVKSPEVGWYEGWVYPEGWRSSVYAVSCTPVSALPVDAAGNAIRDAMAAYKAQVSS